MNEERYTKSEIKRALKNVSQSITNRAYHHFRIQRLKEMSEQKYSKEEYIVIDTPFGNIICEELFIELDRLKG